MRRPGGIARRRYPPRSGLPGAVTSRGETIARGKSLLVRLLARSRELWQKPRVRGGVGFAIILATAVAFGIYLYGHPSLLGKLTRTSPATVLEILLLYLGWFGTLNLTVHAILRLWGMRLPVARNVTLNAYSTLVNFFVPGQSGIAARALYVRKELGLPLRYYGYGTLGFYGCYALVSIAMFLGPSTPIWLFLTVFGAAALAILALVRARTNATSRGGATLNARMGNLLWLLAAAAAQAVFQAAIYSVELLSVNPDITWRQICTYTGAANLSVFVALTPGAIGIRESFLVLSEKLHHISTSVIVAASLLDRAVFILFLGLLFIYAIGTHAKRRLVD